MTHKTCYMSFSSIVNYTRKTEHDREHAKSRGELVDTGKTLLHDLLNKPDWVRDRESFRIWRLSRSYPDVLFLGPQPFRCHLCGCTETKKVCGMDECAWCKGYGRRIKLD
ncbi:MAG TPA: hypothetical protein PKY77_10865 [Phycisphaerae bacterium]|nr:hypothetical protein [Phycisphaerae bacterium]HRY70082.1 hypothetical protein [Phycisphaerae bacterium]HSA27358.1 hypothetical protein [Phycisphaerae bacterium]